MDGIFSAWDGLLSAPGPPLHINTHPQQGPFPRSYSLDQYTLASTSRSPSGPSPLLRARRPPPPLGSDMDLFWPQDPALLAEEGRWGLSHREGPH
jgi:hypothetical protein